MNKSTLLVAGLIVALFLIYLLMIRGSGGSSLPVGAEAFAVLQPDTVGKITIRGIQEGEVYATMSLEREGSEWRLNDSLYALAPKVGRTLTALQQQRVRQPISEAGQKRVRELMDLRRLEVTIEDRAGNPIREFDIGVQTQDSKGTAMRLKGDKTAYVVAIPGVSGYLNTYFVPDPETWRENLLFNIKSQEIARVEITYRETSRQVELVRQMEGWKLRVNRRERQMDPATLETYLAQFNGKLYGETFAAANFPTMTDSLSRREPDYRLSITDKGGLTRELQLYKRPENLNNYFGFIQGNPALRTVQTFVIDPFLKPPRDW